MLTGEIFHSEHWLDRNQRKFDCWYTAKTNDIEIQFTFSAICLITSVHLSACTLNRHMKSLSFHLEKLIDFCAFFFLYFPFSTKQYFFFDRRPKNACKWKGDKHVFGVPKNRKGLFRFVSGIGLPSFFLSIYSLV